MNIKEWLIPMVRRYYEETRRFDRDAWAESYLGRAREEQSGYGQGAMRQSYKEVRGFEGLKLRRAIEGMPYEARCVLEAHFAAAKVPVKEKAKVLGLSVARYWCILDNGYFYLAGRLEALDTEGAENKQNLLVDIA